MEDLDRTATLTLTPSAVADPAWTVRGVGDFNADGKADIVFQHAVNPAVTLWLMNGTTQTQSVAPSRTLLDPTWWVSAVADLNADGYDDLVFHRQGDGYLATWFLNGATVLDTVNLDPYQQDVLAWKMRGAGDYNGDGKLDLLWHHQTSHWIVVWLMNGIAMAQGVTPTPYYLDASQWRLAGPR